MIIGERLGYLTVLVKFFRTHIITTPGVLTLMLGFILHFAQPVQKSDRQNAFTSWLDGHLKSDDSNDVREQLRELGGEEEALEELIRKASEVVALHTEHFELPFSSSDKDQVFDLLITEWNAYQNSSTGMSKAVMPETSKSSAVQLDGKTLSKATAASAPDCSASGLPVLNSWDAMIPPNTLLPLQSGIAINAP